MLGAGMCCVPVLQQKPVHARLELFMCCWSRRLNRHFETSNKVLRLSVGTWVSRSREEGIAANREEPFLEFFLRKVGSVIRNQNLCNSLAGEKSLQS